MPDLLPLDRQGRYEGEHGVFVFDVPRNWALIQGLVEAAGAGALQYIFVADWLRDMLLEHARSQGADAALIATASRLMMQPRATLAHNDHFHLRLYCSAHDIASGCKNTGRIQPGFSAHSAARTKAITRARAALKHEDADIRLASVHRLALLKDSGAARALEDRLEDEDARVRAASARALGELGQGSKAIGEAMLAEVSARAQAEMIVALGERGDRDATNALLALLGSARMIQVDEQAQPIDARLLAMDALAGMEDERPVGALIALITTPTHSLEQRALLERASRALGMLTNHRFLQDWELASEAQIALAQQQWTQWWGEQRRKPRTEWLRLGFERAGFAMRSLSGRSIWALCRAIEGEAHISFNAQRVLMKIGKHYPASLTWSRRDAYYYWRRWYERRYRRFKAPKIPPEMSVLNPLPKKTP